MTRFIVFCLGMLLSSISFAESASDNIFQILSCEYKDIFSEITVEADMTSKDNFSGEGRFTSGNNDELTYPLSQKKPRKGELFRFILDESHPEDSLEIQVFRRKDGPFFKSKATLVGLDSPMKSIDGTCFFY